MSDTVGKFGKITSILTVLVMILVVTVYVMDMFVKDETESVSKLVEIKESVLRGFQNGRKTWQIIVDYAWAGRSRYLFRGEGVHSGTVFDKYSRVVLKDLSAGEVKINSKSKNFEAFGGVKATFIRRGADKSGDESITIEAEKYTYYDATRASYLSQGVALKFKDKTITPAGKVAVDHEKNSVYIADGFMFASDEYVVSANHLLIDIDKEIGEVSGNIFGRRVAEINTGEYEQREAGLRGKPTTFSARFLTYHFGETERVESREQVMIQQADKSLMCQNAHYNLESKAFWAENTIQAETASLEWLVNADSVPTGNDDIQTILTSATHLEADQLGFNGDEKKLTVQGNVEVTQEGLRVACGALSFDDANQRLNFSNSVHLARDRYAVTSNHLILDIDQQIAWATGNITGIRAAQPVDENTDKREAELRRHPTRFASGYLTHWLGESKRLRLVKRVTIVQPDKQLSCDEVSYNITASDFEAKGNVVVDTQNLKWLFDLEDRPTKNEDVRDILESETQFKADTLNFNLDSQHLELKGNVLMTQKKTTVKCNEMAFDEDNQLLIFTGNVQFKRSNGQLVIAQKVIIDIQSEAFKADKKVRFKFKLTD